MTKSDRNPMVLDRSTARRFPDQLDQAEVLQLPYVIADIADRDVELLRQLTRAQNAFVEH